MSDIRVEITTRQGSNPTLRLDVAPIVQACALELAIARLREWIEIIDRYAPLEISPPLDSIAQR